jgi:carotenoid 1,2-hydratase
MAGTPWQLTLFGPKRQAGSRFEADLRFLPILRHPPREQTFLSRRLSGTEHRWVIANPLCQVQGLIHLPQRAPINFRGIGYHDHNYGLGPIGPGLKRWMWGRVLLEDRAAIFHLAVPRRREMPVEVHLVEANASAIAHANDASVCVDWSRHTQLGLQYPERLRVAGQLELSRPQVIVIDPQPFYLRLLYNAKYRGQIGSALCEVAYPSRLRWPIVGRMIEMAIEDSKPRIADKNGPFAALGVNIANNGKP